MPPHSANVNYEHVFHFTDERVFVYTTANNVVNVTFTDPRIYGVILAARY